MISVLYYKDNKEVLWFYAELLLSFSFGVIKYKTLDKISKITHFVSCQISQEQFVDTTH